MSKFYTDYPFRALGDIPLKEAPIRPVILLWYDTDKYVGIEVAGIHTSIKSGYIYTKPVRAGDGSIIPHKELNSLPLQPEEWKDENPF